MVFLRWWINRQWQRTENAETDMHVQSPPLGKAHLNSVGRGRALEHMVLKQQKKKITCFCPTPRPKINSRIIISLNAKDWTTKFQEEAQERLFFIILNTENALEEVPGGPVISTQYFHCSELSFNPWSGN